MFKRQFYALDHPNRGDSASSASESDDSDEDIKRDLEDDAESPESNDESDARPKVERESEGEGVVAGDKEALGSSIPSDDNAAEDSDSEVSGDTGSVQPHEREGKREWGEAAHGGILDQFGGSTVLRIGSKVLKCRLCPKVVCLSDESMEAHLASKGHARSLKQLAAGKLRVRLDSSGEEEEEGETHAERYARTIAPVQVENAKKTKKNSGRHRQRRRIKRKRLNASKS